MMKFLFDALREMVDVLDRLQLNYAVMGGIAVRVHGVARPTQDLDFIVALEADRLGIYFDAIEGIGYSVPEAYRRGWIDSVAGMPLVKVRRYLAEKSLDVDVFLVDSPFQEEMLRRSIVAELDDIRVRVVSAEDLILLKLLAGRYRDMGDVMDVLFMQGRLDEDYLRRWAAPLGVLDKLAEVLAQRREM